ncbi:MAG: threonine-phosphate decarboxylase CobD [Chlorobiales bacterium]|nr:threonine-phosphate decarboxylase CobD [Chlorobiales bacterium]
MTRENLYHHEHGGAPERRFNLNGEPILDFSVSISPLSPPITNAGLDTFSVHRYPSIDGNGINDFYRERYGLDQSTVLPVNGAIEGIYLIPRALGIKKAALLAPSFFDYERACRIAGTSVQFLKLEEHERFMLPGIETIADNLRGVDALVAANPNNPTGTGFPKEIFLALASRFPEKWFIMDEAFIQFVDDFPDASLMRDVRAMKNVIVVHSLTKFYALPGLRLGAIIAHPEVNRFLLGYKEPWTINIVAEKVARDLLRCGDFERELRMLIATERAKIFRKLNGIPEIMLKGHAANFFLAQWNAGPDLDDLLFYLVKKGIYVRDCRNFSGLEENYFRFAVRKPEENDYLLQQLMLAGRDAAACAQ